jgi:hypothetical protein
MVFVARSNIVEVMAHPPRSYSLTVKYPFCLYAACRYLADFLYQGSNANSPQAETLRNLLRSRAG